MNRKRNEHYRRHRMNITEERNGVKTTKDMKRTLQKT